MGRPAVASATAGSPPIGHSTESGVCICGVFIKTEKRKLKVIQLPLWDLAIFSLLLSLGVTDMPEVEVLTEWVARLAQDAHFWQGWESPSIRGLEGSIRSWLSATTVKLGRKMGVTSAQWQTW